MKNKNTVKNIVFGIILLCLVTVFAVRGVQASLSKTLETDILADSDKVREEDQNFEDSPKEDSDDNPDAEFDDNNEADQENPDEEYDENNDQKNPDEEYDENNDQENPDENIPDVQFEISVVSYIFGENDGLISDQKVICGSACPGVTYEVADIFSEGIGSFGKEAGEFGICCDAETGNVYILDFELLGGCLEELRDSLKIVVSAGKATYNIEVGFAKTPDEPYSLSGKAGEGGWYSSDVAVRPAEGWEISLTYKPDDFSQKIEIEESGYLYAAFRDTSTGAITRRLKTPEIKIDKTPPESSDVRIIYGETQTAFSGFYKDEAKIRFEAGDAQSGISSFFWCFLPAECAEEFEKIDDITKYEYLEARAYPDNENEDMYYADIRLPYGSESQLKGFFCIAACDFAGNISDAKTDPENIIVLDSISPVIDITYGGNGGIYYSKDDVLYFPGGANISIRLREANFYDADPVVTVIRNKEVFSGYEVNWIETKNAGEYEALLKLNDEGNYTVKVSYTDRSGNKATDRESKLMVSDSTYPKISVLFDTACAAGTFDSITYYNGETRAKIIVEESNFDEKNVDIKISAKDAEGKNIELSGVSEISEWEHDGNIHFCEAIFLKEAVYGLSVNLRDNAGWEAIYESETFAVDKTPPENISAEYSASPLGLYGNTRFYNAQVRVVVSAEDNISGIGRVTFVYEDLNTGETYETEEVFASAQKERYAVFYLPDFSDESAQFKGRIKVTFEDMAGNKTDYFDERVIVIDSLSPLCAVSWSLPSNTDDGIMYFCEAAEAQINISEANFFYEDAVISVSKDKKSYTVKPTYDTGAAGDHIIKLAFEADGEYEFFIDYADRSGNEMETFGSGIFIVDKTIEKPEIFVNGISAQGMSLTAAGVLTVRAEDANLSDCVVELKKTGMSGGLTVLINESYKQSEFVLPRESDSETFGIKKEYELPENIRENDGVYIATVRAEDKAGNRSEEKAVFTVNRYGSVYVYGDYLKGLIANGGQYVKSIDEDIIITEYNPDALILKQTYAGYTKDGHPADGNDLKISRISSYRDQDEGWKVYMYSIPKQAFEEDGTYKISVSSKDAAGNVSDTELTERIVFHVDATPPEIISVTGLEESVINAKEAAVNYMVFDAMGLSRVSVYVNDEEIQNVTDFSEDMNNFEGTFVLYEKKSSQKIRIEAEDLAGNVADTSSGNTVLSKKFRDFNDEVTVSTDPIVRALSGKTSVIVAAAAAAILVLIIILKKIERYKKQ